VQFKRDLPFAGRMARMRRKSARTGGIARLMPQIFQRFGIALRREVRNKRAFHRQATDAAGPEFMPGLRHALRKMGRNRGARGPPQTQKAVLLAAAFHAGQYKDDLRPFFCQSLRHAKACRSQASTDVGRKFPAKHKHSHG